MLAVPVLTSLAGRGIIPDDHPMSVGGLGAHRNPLSKEMFLSADVIVGIGTKLEEMETNWRDGFLPDPRALYVQNIDPAEHGRSIIPRFPITGDAKTVLKQILSIVAASGRALDAKAFMAHERVARICKAMAAVEAEAEKIATQRRVPIHALLVIRAARNTFPRETTISVDVGCLAQQIAGAMPYFQVYEPRSLVVPSSFYGMGFVASGFPVAKLVYPDRPALCFVGDGSFQMVMNNLPTAVEHNLPVTWCVLNDEAYGSIRDIQLTSTVKAILGPTSTCSLISPRSQRPTAATANASRRHRTSPERSRARSMPTRRVSQRFSISPSATTAWFRARSFSPISAAKCRAQVDPPITEIEVELLRRSFSPGLT